MVLVFKTEHVENEDVPHKRDVFFSANKEPKSKLV